MQILEWIPKASPSTLLARDWSQRRCFARYGKEDFLERSHNMEVREDDVFVVTLPKCGTTRMQELVWLLLHDFDFEAAKREPQELRSPFLEFNMICDVSGEKALESITAAASPRLIKTHLPLPMLPKQVWTQKPKTIYVFRNPKDALVSAYYYRQNFGLNLDISVEDQIRKELEFEKETQSYWNHVLEFWQLRNEDWVYYTSFEKMKEDLPGEIDKICRFLGTTITDDQLEKMMKHLSFRNMKNNPQCNHVWEIETARKLKNITVADNQRKDEVGDYSEELSPELIKELDDWIQSSLAPHKLTLEDLLLLK